MTDLIFHSTTREQLADLMREVVQTELASLRPQSSTSTDELLTRKEVAEMLSISLPTLHEWTKEGTIKAYRIGRAIRYKHDDVQNALTEIRSIKYKRK